MRNGKGISITVVIAALLITLVCVGAGATGAREAAPVRDLAGVHGVSFSTSGDLIITQGDRESLEIIARPADLDRLVTEVRDGTLFIGRNGSSPFLDLQPPVFRLTLKTIDSLEAHSSGKISAKSLLVDSLRIQVSSSGGVSIDALDADTLDVRISSSGSVRLGGKVGQQNLILSSSGNYAGAALASQRAKVRVSSSGTATLRVSEALEAVVTSSGNLRYHGNPAEVDAKATSSGRIVRLGD